MLVALNKIFDIEYGNGMGLNSLTKCNNSNDSVNFISRTSKNNGVAGIVENNGTEPFPKGLITVAVSGSVLSTFLQPKEFYTAFHVMVLTPKTSMTDSEKLFYCACIEQNKYKYSYGRQANRTLKNLPVPSTNEIPKWVYSLEVDEILDLKIEDSKKKPQKTKHSLNDLTPLESLFETYNGIVSTGLKRTTERINDNYVPYIRPSSTQVSSSVAYVDKTTIAAKFIFPKDTLYVSTNGQGSHSFAYVSIEDFIPNSDVTVLIPKVEMSFYEKYYYSLAITKNRPLFSYGRKPKGKKLKKIMLPKTPPKWIYKKGILEEILNAKE